MEMLRTGLDTLRFPYWPADIESVSYCTIIKVYNCREDFQNQPFSCTLHWIIGKGWNTELKLLRCWLAGMCSLCCVMLLAIGVAVSVAADSDSWMGLEGESSNNSLSCTPKQGECPPALICSNGQCECVEEEYPGNKVRCHDGELLVKRHYCVTYNKTTKLTSTGECVRTFSRQHWQVRKEH